jgi:hypothetical protein
MPKKTSQPATKQDLISLEKRTDIRFDAILKLVKEEIKETRQFVKEEAKKTRRHFDVVAENIYQDVAGANHDEISFIKDQKIPDLERRVAALEQRR